MGLLTPLQLDQLPEKCVHGTYLRHWPSILRRGLLAGGLSGQSRRKHVHFISTDVVDGGGIISGLRSNCEVAIYVDLPRAIEAGIPFFVSKNEVILSPGRDGTIPTEFFSSAK